MTRLEWILAIAVGLTFATLVAAAVVGWTDTPIQSCGTECAR